MTLWLVLYAFSLVCLGGLLRVYLRSAPKSTPTIHSFQPFPGHLGYVTGGAVRARDVWWAQLREAAWLVPTSPATAPPTYLIKPGTPLPPDDACLALALSSLHSPTTHAKAMQGFLSALQRAQTDLVEAGWLATVEGWQARLRARLAYYWLLGLSMAGFFATPNPVWIKFVAFMGAGVLARWAGCPRRLLSHGQEEASRWVEMTAAVQQAPRVGEAGLAVAIGGTLALSGTPFSEYAPPVQMHHVARRQSNNDSASSGGCGSYSGSSGGDCGGSSSGSDCGGSSGCGSSGCGGGGCGS